MLACLAAALLTLTSVLSDGGKGFWIQDDKFYRDGKAVQIISGRSASFHQYSCACSSQYVEGNLNACSVCVTAFD